MHGRFFTLSIAEAADKYLVDGKWHFPEGTTETEEGIYERACKALVELQMNFVDETIIVVTHGQFARNIIAAHFECSYHEVASFVNAEIRKLNI